MTYYEALGLISKEISDLVCGLSCLRQVLLDVTLNRKALVHLASLPNLWRLHGSIPYEHVAQGYREPFPSLAFPALKVLNAQFGSIANAGDFLQILSTSSKLEYLTIGVLTTPSSQELHMFLTMVHQSCSRYTLTTVSLRHTDDAIWEDPPYPLEAYAFLPLLQCPNVENIPVDIPYEQQTIDNALMKDMALAWPHLRQIDILHLGIDDHWQSRVNLEGLFHLAQHCHRLESVRHQFDVSLPTNPMNAEQDRIRNESMTYLDVGYSRVTDPCTVAASLFDIFPNLGLHHSWDVDNIASDDEDEDLQFMVMHKRWGEVGRWLTDYQESGEANGRRL